MTMIGCTVTNNRTTGGTPERGQGLGGGMVTLENTILAGNGHGPGQPDVEASLTSFGIATDARGNTRPCDQPAIANAGGGDGADVGAFEEQATCAVANVAPDAVDDHRSVAEDSGANVVNVLTNDTDANGDTLTITAVTQGANGFVSTNGTSVSYTPASAACSAAFVVGDGPVIGPKQ